MEKYVKEKAKGVKSKKKKGLWIWLWINFTILEEIELFYSKKLRSKQAERNKTLFFEGGVVFLFFKWERSDPTWKTKGKRSLKGTD